jgi:hypothetical protein
MYKISNHTIDVFSENARERFCIGTIEDLMKDGIIKKHDKETLLLAISLSKQAETTGVYSKAGQFRYLMASFKFEKAFTHNKKINYAIKDIIGEEEKMLFLDKIIDDFVITSKELKIG